MDQIFDFQNVENDEPEFQRNHSIVKITIYIKTIAGSTLDFVVPETETVESLKAKIEEATGVPIWKQMLIFACKVLEDNTILSDYNITNDSSINLIIRYKTSKIHIKTLFDEIIDLDYDQNETIGSIKKKIETIKRIEADKQILLYNSNKLQDNKTILECGINKESIIVLIIMEETEKLNEKLKNEIKFLEKALLEEINKNEKMEELLKKREILLNDLNSQIQSLKYEKEKIIKVLENELEKEGEYKKRIEKLERGYKKKKYVEEDFLEVKEFLEKEKEKEIQIYLKNLISIIFISNEQGIYWSVICNKTDSFSKLQQSFFERYPEYNEENNYFVFNGINIEKENTLKDIGIKHNDLIIMKEK